jgi:polyhydroxyalkanoate synthesis regulator phasin
MLFTNMNPDELIQTAQKGFHITLGATASLVESLQDTRKREENVAKFQQDWESLSEELAEKGRQTEREARSFVDGMISQQGSTSSQAPASPGQAPQSPTAPPDIQQDIQDLTAQVAAMRAELERLRKQDPSA